jgi:hypothetical protein
MMLARFRRFAPVLLALFTWSCYQYNDPPSQAAMPMGKDVRVVLTPLGRSALARQLGPQVRIVSGKLTSADTSGMTVSARQITLLDGTEAPWSGEPVVMPAAYVERASVKSVSTSRTVLLIALVTAAAVAISVAIGHGSSSGDNSVGQHPGQ